MTDDSNSDLILLIAELSNKNLLSLDKASNLIARVDEQNDLVRLELAGNLHGLIDSNEISREEAEPFIRRLGIPQDKLDFHLVRLREERTKKRGLH